ncbi:MULTISPECIES: 2OG-Fe(II)-dependent halogenase WelO5 family protein [Photorhabdus]|uniref:Prolyl 4-hydroxylase alpha subunit Fe(2+) 2OG dioxygenase domain-containing protein n=1 Tax=Photorhabdus kayaii TaxID=230088 RepID=A0ABX0ATP1_9GAMM|nr:MULTISPECIES: hypothetical protein [Photorhabdus]MCC8372592.1 hypothetical protein [Photorhabdus bodei]MCT8351130.1 hypothetical protein [Photorhabdus kayaii]NDL10655.1 hypothetical protein [Photorhabdus kayaii]NDL24121.1 hypothetical protein [Photorhabdus kayaii]RAX11994.1 hypothetical protein CKY10_01885 [Photorhabdus sp. HUG-39]
MSSRWVSNELVKLSSESLQAIIDNKIPAAMIDDFATPKETEQLSSAILSMKAKPYEFGRPGFYLGNTLAHYRDQPKEQYFAQVSVAEQDRIQIINQAFDPVDRFMQYINHDTNFSISVAEEPGFGPYFTGIVRIISGGSDLHVDYAPTFAKGNLVVGDISTQLAWNLYILSPSQGGETVIYNQPFKNTTIDKIYKPYDSALLVNCESFTFRPQVGSVVIFNTTNPHIVLPASGNRIATGSFIGVLNEKKLILWS